jgi:hypothetical protein
MEEKSKIGKTKKDFYRRAAKNVPSNFEFWVGYMRELEKASANAEEIQ